MLMKNPLICDYVPYDIAQDVRDKVKNEKKENSGMFRDAVSTLRNLILFCTLLLFFFANIRGQAMSDDRRKPSFWKTIPGIITAIGTLLGGAAALITALYTVHIIGTDDPGKVPAEPARDAVVRKPQGDKNTGTVQAEEGERDSSAKRGELPQKDKTIGQYIDHGDGTITDTKTGLMWKRCSEGLSGENCEEGKAEKYNWNDAVKRFKDVDYAGYSDWRLPTIDELKTLVYCSKGADKKYDWCNDGSESPTINQQAFPNTENWAYWSGSPNANLSTSAWGVIFNYGDSSDSSRYSNLAVRLLRGGQ
ncbi:MAG: DUF1566 domain-containing protein [Candidatus Electrothrix sp. AUS1_2]|nr:DUF1566 domain-containing protein [Candidatus Electrothrix sp. AUS1_2]